MKGFIVFLALVAAASAFHPSALDSIRRLSPQKRANNVWSILVAGSNSYSNYRHQSDICQMYQTLRKLSVPEAHIIVMMYDDIASNSQNPYKGKIYNSPGHQQDVYAGVPKDYIKNTVTPSNFITLLTGSAPSGGSGKKLLSTTNDHVFIFFSDHGDSGILCFPSGDLSKAKLESGLQKMYDNHLYGSLVFHVEACYAGSMFYNSKLPPNAYIHTASPVSASSYAWQWDDDINAYVSDVWSWYTVHYMEDHPQNTMQEMFDYDYTTMGNWSIPCQYGETTVAAAKIGDYFSTVANRRYSHALPTDAVKAYNVTYNVALRMHKKLNNAETQATLDHEIAVHKAVDLMAEHVVAAAGLSLDEMTNDKVCKQSDNVMRCAEELARQYRKECGKKHEYLGRITELLVPVCRASENTEAVSKVIHQDCATIRAAF